MKIETHTFTEDNGLHIVILEGLSLKNFSKVDGLANHSYKEGDDSKAIFLSPESVTVAIGNESAGLQVSITNSQGRMINLSALSSVVVDLGTRENTYNHYHKTISRCMTNNVTPTTLYYAMEDTGAPVNVPRATSIAVKEDGTIVHLTEGDDQEAPSYLTFTSPKARFKGMKTH